jgi:hypothetical protein
VAISSSNSWTPIGYLARMGGFLMTLVAGRDLHVRLMIARTASRARPRLRNGLEFKASWHARDDLAARPRAE